MTKLSKAIMKALFIVVYCVLGFTAVIAPIVIVMYLISIQYGWLYLLAIGFIVLCVICYVDDDIFS